jgi:hypothetical protein
MTGLSIYQLRELLDTPTPPCISLYQPTHRRHPDNQQDPIRYRNLVDQAEASLRREYPGREVRPLLDPFRALQDDREFWNHALDGLAVFGAPGVFRAYRLQRTVPELTVVAESYHTKPLLRFVQSADRYQVLGLGRDAVLMWEGNRDVLDPIDPADEVPRSVGVVLGEGAAPRGPGFANDPADIDTEQFFRAVDRAVLEQHSRPSGLPLVLVALAENQEVFRRFSQSPFLLADGVRFDPGSLAPERLREEVWGVVQPRYLQRLADLVGAFEEARSKHQASGDPSDIAQAAVASRVATLLVEAQRELPGHLDPATGRIEHADLAHPAVDDLLDDLAELVLQRGGEVVVVPADRMPTQSGAAAIYRF